MKTWFSPLLFLLATSSEEDLRRQIEFLKAESEMLRSRAPKKKIFLTNDERERLLKLGEAIGSGVSKVITILHPKTYQRWLRNKRNGRKPAKKMGRTVPFDQGHSGHTAARLSKKSTRVTSRA